MNIDTVLFTRADIFTRRGFCQEDGRYGQTDIHYSIRPIISFFLITATEKHIFGKGGVGWFHITRTLPLRDDTKTHV